MDSGGCLLVDWLQSQCRVAFDFFCMRSPQDFAAGVAAVPGSVRYRSRPTTPRVRGHRFSKEAEEQMFALPMSPKSKPTPFGIKIPPLPPPPSAPHVLLLDPGIGEACDALLQTNAAHVHLAIGPKYDMPVRRYPPHWRTMAGVCLTEAEAEVQARKHAAIATSSVWPGVSDLRGVVSVHNLATWASVVYDGAAGGRLSAVNLTAAGADRATGRALPTVYSGVNRFACIVCGSRGGEVTLPALWLLGCRLPAVVINGGCARESVAWVWPAGVPVLLLTGGADQICNEFHRQPAPERDVAYLTRLWRGVPEASRPTTAVVHVPSMPHRPDRLLLEALLPALVHYAASGLSSSARPSLSAIGSNAAILCTAEKPRGEWLA